MRTGRGFANPVVRGALLTAFGVLLAGGNPQKAIAQTSETYTTFSEWCANKERISANARYTVEVLLERAETQDCDAAEDRLATLTTLSIGSPSRNYEIQDLAPLSSLNNLEELTIHSQELKDITPLATLTNLQTLYLFGHHEAVKTIDITPLAKLINLKKIRIWSIKIEDLAPLTKLKNLETLNLLGNQIENIDSLSSLTNLTSLYIWVNKVKNITPLSRLTNLTSLALTKNQIQDITPLSGLTNLTSLSLDENQIQNISPLSNLTNIEGISLHGNPIENFMLLAKSNNLTTLYLPGDEGVETVCYYNNDSKVDCKLQLLAYLFSRVWTVHQKLYVVSSLCLFGLSIIIFFKTQKGEEIPNSQPKN